MHSRLHKNTLKTAVPRRFPDGSQTVPGRFPGGSQNALFSVLILVTRRSLVNGVSEVVSYCAPQCRFGHISTWVNNANDYVFGADNQNSGSYEATGGD